MSHMTVQSTDTHNGIHCSAFEGRNMCIPIDAGTLEGAMRNKVEMSAGQGLASNIYFLLIPANL